MLAVEGIDLHYGASHILRKVAARGEVMLSGEAHDLVEDDVRRYLTV